MVQILASWLQGCVVASCSLIFTACQCHHSYHKEAVDLALTSCVPCPMQGTFGLIMSQDGICTTTACLEYGPWLSKCSAF